MGVKSLNVGLKLPFLDIGTTWTPNDAEAKASWELLVELSTRTAVIGLHDDDGVLREALGSLFQLFGITREILKRYGPGVAPNSKVGEATFGIIAIRILNDVLRPFLSSWHPALDTHEKLRPASSSAAAWEREWDRHVELRADLKALRSKIRAFVDVLGEAAGTQQFAASVQQSADLGPQ